MNEAEAIICSFFSLITTSIIKSNLNADNINKELIEHGLKEIYKILEKYSTSENGKLKMMTVLNSSFSNTIQIELNKLLKEGK